MTTKLQIKLPLNTWEEKQRLQKLYKFDEEWREIKLNRKGWTFARMCKWFKEAGSLTDGKPTFKYFKDETNMLYYDDEKDRWTFLQLHYNIPDNYKKYFKSPKDAYRHALDFYDVGKKNVFGYTCKAKDGHLCNSLAEAKIDDFLYENKLSHEKEPPYPYSTWRADFKIGKVYLEYFGMTGQKNYDEKTKAKIEYAEKRRLKLISIYPDDMKENKFKEKILQGLSS